MILGLVLVGGLGFLLLKMTKVEKSVNRRFDIFDQQFRRQSRNESWRLLIGAIVGLISSSPVIRSSSETDSLIFESPVSTC